LPNGWTCAHLSEIATFGGGKTPSTEEKRFWQNGQYLWVTSKDMKNEIISDSKLKLSTDGIQELSLYSPGTILMVVRSGILRRTLPIAILKNAATINQDLKAIIPLIAKMSDYIYWFIKANEYYILENYQKDGTTVESINFEKFQDIEIPIPPLSEQNRIIYQLQKWMQFIDNIEHCKEALSSDITKTKSIILNLAISGKLVPQDPNDESAIEALRCINPSFQPCDNPQYRNKMMRLPRSWCCASFNSINCYKSKSVNPALNPSNKYELYSVPTFDSGLPEFLKGKEIASTKALVKSNDVLLCKINPHLNRAWVVSHYKKDLVCIASSEWIVFRNDGLNPQYMQLCFTSPYFKDLMMSNVSGVGGSLTRAQPIYVKKIIVPIPPIAEQQRIVDKVTELFALLDNIQNSLEA
jgi:type I restriction enzyme S subunit